MYAYDETEKIGFFCFQFNVIRPREKEKFNEHKTNQQAHDSLLFQFESSIIFSKNVSFHGVLIMKRVEN